MNERRTKRDVNSYEAGSFEPRQSYLARGVNPDRLRAIRDYAVGAVLDVGCGSGAYIDLLADDRPAVGVDHRASPGWHAPRFLVGDAAILPLPAGCFDTLLVFETLEHLDDPVAALAEYRRVTRQRLIVTVPNASITQGMRSSNLIYHHWIDPTHVNFWTPDEFCDLISSAGFRVLELRLINRIDLVPFLHEALRIPLRLMRVSRVLDRRWNRAYKMTTLVVADVA